MRRVVVVMALGLVVGVWGCDKSGGDAEAQAPEEHGHAHEEGAAHGHEHGSDHEGDQDHDHAKSDHEGDHDHGKTADHEGDHEHGSDHDHEHAEGDHDHEGDHHEGDHEHAEGGHHEGDHHDEGPNYAKEGTVEVPKKGKKFEPPVAVDRLPAGAWYCDMGKTPWAATEKPKDGCPIEGAPLKQKTSK